MSLPDLVPVRGSSNVAAIGHKDGHLYVKFHDGGIYRYPNQAERHHALLMAADSKGRYLHRNGLKGQRV